MLVFCSSSWLTKVKFFCPGAEGGLLLGHLHIIQLQEGSTKESTKESSEDENDDGESEDGESEEEVRTL